MATVAAGGASSAVAASAHAGCERFRRSDPLLTGRSRRKLATELGFPDESGTIPEARWMRAMLFERLVHDDAFISELMTRGVGLLGLERPSGVQHMGCRRNERRTVQALDLAHRAALEKGIATMVTESAIPLAGFEAGIVTPVLPDFLVVARRTDENGMPVGSWLIAGDAKDYERIRSRIDDSRLLKGFLQVALGAESADRWTGRPQGMVVHEWGFLAVPRTAYLRPQAVVERLEDHRREVRSRLEQRIHVAAAFEGQVKPIPAELVTHSAADFDPARCVTCSLFLYCRDEIRGSTDPIDLMTEIGIERALRPTAAALLEGADLGDGLPSTVRRRVIATAKGQPQWAAARRTDPAGEPGTVNVVLVKSDAAALGIHGVGVQAVTEAGPGTWDYQVFTEPRTPLTRSRILGAIGRALESVDRPGRAVHVCVPDRMTGDLLATMADSASGVEISRLRWARDVEAGRPALTFDGQPAVMPEPLEPETRLAVSFFLDEDRARAFAMRTPVVILQEVMARLMVAGGPEIDSGRLDYLAEWATADGPADHRAISDLVSLRLQAPGARTTIKRSNAIHAAEQAAEWETYRTLVLDELAFRAEQVGRVMASLSSRPRSALTAVYEAVELEAQEVWRRRLELHASDLVRFSLTNRPWRNHHVSLLDADRGCAAALRAMVDPEHASDLANDAGNRAWFQAEVVGTTPLVLRSAARAIAPGMELALMHVDGEPEMERPAVSMKPQKGSFKFTGLSVGEVQRGLVPGEWLWSPATPATHLTVGARLVLADPTSFGGTVRNGLDLKLDRPSVDTDHAPRVDCTPDSYADDPKGHLWCCRSHEAAEAEWSDVLAGRRAKGELNPDVWPPIVDVENFEIPGDENLAEGQPAVEGVPEDLTVDDLE